MQNYLLTPICAGLYGPLRSSLLASLSKPCDERCHCTGRYLCGPMYKPPVLTCCTAFVQCEKCEASSKQDVFSVHVLVLPVFVCNPSGCWVVRNCTGRIVLPAEDFIDQAEPKVTDLYFTTFHPKTIWKLHHQILHLSAHMRSDYMIKYA